MLVLVLIFIYKSLLYHVKTISVDLPMQRKFSCCSVSENSIADILINCRHF